MAAQLLTQRQGDTLILTLSNPGARNALGPEMYVAALEALATAGSDADIRAIVLTGADGVFCAGGNLNRLLDNRGRDRSVQAASIDQLHLWIETMRACPKPIIAAVEGAAAGAGFSLALACDMIVAARGARFVMAYARVALTPDGGGSWHLSRMLPRPLASEILMEGKPVDAERLHHFGIVNRLCAPGDALNEALGWAADLAALSPHALGRIKGLIDAAAGQSLTAHLNSERESFVEALHHPDGGEGIRAFLEKRKAQYRG